MQANLAAVHRRPQRWQNDLYPVIAFDVVIVMRTFLIRCSKEEIYNLLAALATLEEDQIMKSKVAVKSGDLDATDERRHAAQATGKLYNRIAGIARKADIEISMWQISRGAIKPPHTRM